MDVYRALSPRLIANALLWSGLIASHIKVIDSNFHQGFTTYSLIVERDYPYNGHRQISDQIENAFLELIIVSSQRLTKASKWQIEFTIWLHKSGIASPRLKQLPVKGRL